MSRSDKKGASYVSDPTVVVRNVTKQYYVSGSRSEDAAISKFGHRKGQGQVVSSLVDVSFTAQSGESIGLVGRNGSGKSTLLSLIAGAQSPTIGEILVRARPTLLGVSPALQPYLTGEQNIYLGCLAIGMSKREAKESLSEIAEWAEIGDAIRRPMSTYSSGQSARLIFAISTAISPDILLVDEALSTGDAAFAKKAEERMSQLLSGAGNLFLVSHNSSQIERNCERVLWIHQGSVIADGESSEVVEQYDKWSSLSSAGQAVKADQLLEEVREDYKNPLILFQREAEAFLEQP